MSTIFEQPSSSNSFSIKNRGGIKRIKKNDGPTNFYQQIEYNADRLLLNFPQKDKIQLMKLLEELDNQVEVAHEILSSEITSSSQSNINSAFKTQQYQNNSNNGFSDFEMASQNNYNNSNNQINMMAQMMNLDANKYMADKEVLKERRILKNIKPKNINKDGQRLNQGIKGQQQQGQVQMSCGGAGLQQIQQSSQSPRRNSINFNSIQMEDSLQNDRQNPQLKSQMSYGTPTSANQLESKISQEISATQLDDQIYQRQTSQQNQKKQQQSLQNIIHQDNDDDDQQSATQEDDSQSQTSQEQGMSRHQDQQYTQQQQQMPQSNRLKDINQINQYQKQLVDTIIPQLIQQLKNSNIDQAPDLLLQGFKYYEEENRRGIQYDKILSTHDAILKGIKSLLNKKQDLEKEVSNLSKDNQKLIEERDKYRHISERFYIMFQSNNQQQQQQQHFHNNNFFDKGGDSGMCF